MSDERRSTRIRVPTIDGTPAERELIPPDPLHSVYWSEHGYPTARARWNYHPEVEIHLIRRGTGRFIVGSGIGNFSAGHVAIVGSGVPHDWMSDLAEGEVIEDRDALIQFLPEWLEAAGELLPELHEMQTLLHQASRGIEFLGDTARAAGAEILAVGAAEGLSRLRHLLTLFEVLVNAPPSERRAMSPEGFVAAVDPVTEAAVESGLAYIVQNLSGQVSLAEAARRASVSPSTYSKHFKLASGLTFTDMVRKLRVSHAVRLLTETSTPVSEISQRVGFGNLSNFNRQFKTVTGQTPRAVRSSGGR
ncbi:MAG: AraC family transcriptional regulator [Micrococcales bacterium]|nr:AraC family transcriptional regulator [Micrococcales bacterium]